MFKKIYGEKNAVFFSSLVLSLSTLSRWIFLFIDNVRNSFRVLIVVFMILLLLFINTNAFNFNEDYKRKKLGIEDGLIRLSVGIEHIDDILADLAQALE